VNGFTFDGFPGVQIKRSPFGFSLWLTHGSTKTSRIEISQTEGEQLAKDFQAKRQIPRESFKKVQELLIELESLTGRGRAKGGA
jgi:hypothetical protein